MRRPIIVEPERLARLTEAQRVCLRLIYKHQSSKDIGREIGISPHSVDARVRAALQTLGIGNRVDAALALAEHEGGRTYQPSAYQSPHIAEAAFPEDFGGATATGADPDDSPSSKPYPTARDAGPGLLGETRMPFNAAAHGYFEMRAPSLRVWGGRNELTLFTRLGMTMLIAIASALAFGAILAGLAALRTLSS